MDFRSRGDPIRDPGCPSSSLEKSIRGPGCPCGDLPKAVFHAGCALGGSFWPGDTDSLAQKTGVEDVRRLAHGDHEGWLSAGFGLLGQILSRVERRVVGADPEGAQGVEFLALLPGPEVVSCLQDEPKVLGNAPLKAAADSH